MMQVVPGSGADREKDAWKEVHQGEECGKTTKETTHAQGKAD